MLRTLEKHLSQFKKSTYQNTQQGQLTGGYVTPNTSNVPMNLNYSASYSMKEESSPGKSPASSWHSPNALTGGSPSTSSQGPYTQSLGGANAYNMTPTHPTQHGNFSQAQAAQMNAPRSGAQRRAMGDLSDMGNQEGSNKRQQMYPPQSSYQQQ